MPQPARLAEIFTGAGAFVTLHVHEGGHELGQGMPRADNTQFS
ncbi:MAG: hypothetical protein ACRD2G_03485 [Terriglobia bacterium]